MSTPKRVLLIDDDEDDCFFFQTALEDVKPPVSFSFNQDSEAAMATLTQDVGSKPDLLFLDWNMPKLTGRQCLKAIRSNPDLASTPVIVYTTSNSPIDRNQARELGASYYLPKPASLGELRTKLQDLFSIDWQSEI